MVGSDQVTLIEGDDGSGYRRLTARLHQSGDVVFEGHDLGGATRELLGAYEYEYSIVVKAADVPMMVRALGGNPGDDVLQLLTTRRDDPNLATPLSFLSTEGVEYEFWSRRGD